MKIAVLIAGEYREFPIAHKFWNFLKWPNIDCYFATWDKSIFVNKNSAIPDIVETVTMSSITEFIHVIDADIAESTPIPINGTTAYKQINRWKSAIQLLINSNKKYDRVILIRPDIALDYDEGFLKKFMEENNGDLLFDSDAVNTTFIIRFNKTS